MPGEEDIKCLLFRLEGLCFIRTSLTIGIGLPAALQVFSTSSIKRFIRIGTPQTGGSSFSTFTPGCKTLTCSCQPEAQWGANLMYIRPIQWKIMISHPISLPSIASMLLPDSQELVVVKLVHSKPAKRILFMNDF
jgi:hypothetical protein